MVREQTRLRWKLPRYWPATGETASYFTDVLKQARQSGIATETLTGANATEDIGLYGTSFASGLMGRSTFSDFAVTQSPFSAFSSPSPLPSTPRPRPRSSFVSA